MDLCALEEPNNTPSGTIQAQRPPTSEIMANIHELEMEIGKNLAELEELINYN